MRTRGTYGAAERIDDVALASVCASELRTQRPEARRSSREARTPPRCTTRFSLSMMPRSAGTLGHLKRAGGGRRIDASLAKSVAVRLLADSPRRPRSSRAGRSRRRIGEGKRDQPETHSRQAPLTTRGILQSIAFPSYALGAANG